MKKESIVIYVDVLERWHFFSKFYTPLQAEGHKVWFVTARLSIAQQIKKLTSNLTILKEHPDNGPYDSSVDLTQSLSVLNHYHSLLQAQEISDAVNRQMQVLSTQHDITMIWIWNGTTTIAKTLTSFARKNRIERRYFEISNLSKLIFVDTEGTSGASYLCAHPEILDNNTVDEKEYQQWLSAYHQEDLIPRQAENRAKIPWPALIDMLGYLRGYIKEDRRSVFRLLINRLSNKFSNPIFEEADLVQPYVFLPLQVSDDSQLKLFSTYSNIDLLQQALYISHEKGARLLVKIHPAESDRDEIKQLTRLSKKGAFSIVDNPTKSLIRQAELIIVNNSTVGLQALIEEKEIMVFGNALYKAFDQTRLKQYILDYLLPADYFGEETIPTDTITSILTRAKWSHTTPKERVTV